MAGNFPARRHRTKSSLSSFECLNALYVYRVLVALFPPEKRRPRVNFVLEPSTDRSPQRPDREIPEVLKGKGHVTTTERILSITLRDGIRMPSLAAVRSWGYREFLA